VIGRFLSRTTSRNLYGVVMVGLGGTLLLFLVLPFVALLLDGGPDSI
jgi:hypothetical protein